MAKKQNSFVNLKKKVSDYSKLLGFVPNRGGYFHDTPTAQDIEYLYSSQSICVPRRKLLKRLQRYGYT